MTLPPPNPDWIAEESSGDNYVLIHGMVMAPSFWRTYAPMVVRQGKSAAYPLPGHHPWRLPEPGQGFDADAVADAYAAAIRRDFDGEPVTLIGHSTGGFVSLLIAKRYPHLVRAVVLMGAFACGRFEGQERLPAKMLRVPKVGPFLFRQFFLRWISTAEQFRWGSLECVYDMACPWENEQAKESMENVRLDLLRSRPEDIAACIRFMSSTSLLAGLTEIAAPVLNIVGANDAIVPPPHQLRVSKLLPQTQTVILNQCGHLPMVERRAETDHAIKAFIATVPISAHATPSLAPQLGVLARLLRANDNEPFSAPVRGTKPATRRSETRPQEIYQD